MKNTRFMEAMFSNTDEELAKQVDSDIKSAQAGNVVDTDEVKYERTGNGNDVAITDKANGEVTIAQKSADEADTYDLIAVPDEQLEKYVHPSSDGVTPGNQVGAPDEYVKTHLDGRSVISPNLPDGGLNPDAGHERSVTEVDDEHQDACPACGQSPCVCGEEGREFSVTSDNDAWQKIFSMPQEFVDYLFSEVIESEETSKVGDLKVEKLADEDNAVIVTSESTGDQVKVKLEGDEMEVTELNSKSFSNDEQFMPLFVIGVQPYDHIIVDAQEYGQESAEELKAQLEEDGVEAVQIFDNQDEAREYAINLLNSLGANPAAGDVDEPELQKEYSEAVGSVVYTTSYRTDDSVLMSRMFSEEALGVADTQDTVEDAIKSGQETDMDGAIVIPVDATNAIIQDGDEFTKATLNGEDMILENIDPEEAQAILGDSDIMEYEAYDDDEDDDERDFSDVYTDEYETKFFSEYEDFTDYMERLFSDESDQEHIEDAIENGEEIENETEIITPVSATTAVVEDKETGEFTKAVLDDGTIDVHPIDKDEAEDMIKDIKVEDEVDDDEEDDDEEDEKEYSDVYTDDTETRFFSGDEEFTDYMERLFTGESDQDVIEDAIEGGQQVENEEEIITPVNRKTAVVEDKGNGEFSKVTILNDDQINVHPISEDEADELTGDLVVDDEEEVEPEQGEFSDVYTDDTETRFFSEDEDFTDYMERLFTGEADEKLIEDAIEDGQQVENDGEVITPVDSKTAVVEDKETGEFTKATLSDDDIDVEPISEEEADELTEDLKVENTKEEEDEKKFSENNELLARFFADAGIQQAQPQQVVAAQPVAPAPAPAEQVVVDQNGNPVDPNAVPVEEGAPAPTVENIEDKALAAIQSIKAAVEEGAAQIMEAKAAPAPNAEPQIQEAQFSDFEYCDDDDDQRTFSENDTLISWLANK